MDKPTGRKMGDIVLVLLIEYVILFISSVLIIANHLE